MNTRRSLPDRQTRHERVLRKDVGVSVGWFDSLRVQYRNLQNIIKDSLFAHFPTTTQSGNMSYVSFRRTTPQDVISFAESFCAGQNRCVHESLQMKDL